MSNTVLVAGIAMKSKMTNGITVQMISINVLSWKFTSGFEPLERRNLKIE